MNDGECEYEYFGVRERFRAMNGNKAGVCKRMGLPLILMPLMGDAEAIWRVVSRYWGFGGRV